MVNPSLPGLTTGSLVYKSLCRRALEHIAFVDFASLLGCLYTELPRSLVAFVALDSNAAFVTGLISVREIVHRHSDLMITALNSQLKKR